MRVLDIIGDAVDLIGGAGSKMRAFFASGDSDEPAKPSAQPAPVDAASPLSPLTEAYAESLELQLRAISFVQGPGVAALIAEGYARGAAAYLTTGG